MGVDRETIVVYVPSFLWHDLKILDCGLGNGGVFKQRDFHVKAAKHLRESVHAFEYNQMSPVLFTANFTDRENA